MNPAGEQRSIAETNMYPWMLLPAVVLGDNPHTLANLAMFQGFKLPHRQRNSAPYVPGVAFRENLKQHWTAVEAMGPYVLYEPTR
ncbi:MAG: hypothetical protein ACRYFU_24775 [Janthinobacterium lividum]